MVVKPQLIDYLDNTQPWAKQQEAFEAALNVNGANQHHPLFALFMEQRTGKSITTIGLMAYWWEHREIDAVVGVAMPGGVPANWRDEINGTPSNNPPSRLPSWVPRHVVVWDCGRFHTKAFQADLQKALTFKGLSIILCPGEATTTDNWRTWMAKFVRSRRVFAFVDESSLVMARPGNKRAKIIRGLGRHAPHRMILDGTPAGESPLAMYPQMAFLDTGILGPENFTAFKAFYAEYEDKTNHNTGQAYKALTAYRNIDVMAERLTPVSFRCTRAECYDIPPKQYLPYHFDLSLEQRRVYDDLDAQYEAELHDGTQVSASMALTRYLRFQQITSNYWPSTLELILCPDCAGAGC